MSAHGAILRLPFRMPERSRVANASLELAGSIPLPPDGRDAKRADVVASLYERVTNAPSPPVYAERFRMQDDMRQALAHCEVFTCDVQGRMIVGLGDESSRETSITLQRLDGMPYIPGSAQKGLARRVALYEGAGGFTIVDPATGERRPLNDTEREVLTGSVTSAGYVTFLDAWYVPGSATGDRPLRRDVMTPHHTNYNTRRGGSAPTDFEDPVPVPFLSAIGQYRFAVIGPDDAWAALAKAVLLFGLRHWGVGAKTSSGYGRLVEV